MTQQQSIRNKTHFPMIENHFKPGVRLKWDKPLDGNAPEDGSISEHPTITRQLVCEGLDPHLGNALTRGVAQFRNPAIQRNTLIAYNWLTYTPGQTQKTHLVGDTLSGWMSGCYIVTWRQTGRRYVGHIGTTHDMAKNRLVKNTFGLSMPRQVQGYSPADAWTNQEMAQMASTYKVNLRPKVVSLVTMAGQFYSILLMDLGMNPDNIRLLGNPNAQLSTVPYYLVAGIKLVPSLSYETLLHQLTPF